MFYKKIGLLSVAALLAMQSAVCSATVPEQAAGSTQPKVLNAQLVQQAAKKAERQRKQAEEQQRKAVKQQKQSAEQNKKVAKQQRKAAKQKQSQQPIIVGKTDSIVVSNKPVVYKDVPQLPKATGTIQTPASSLLQERDGKYYFLRTELPENYRSISIYGTPIATKTQAAAYIRQTNPEVKLACSIEELVELYWQEAERERVRPDLALAQSLVETATYKYGGDVLHHQNNFCGLGTTGGGVRGASFATPELGVRAHIQHLLAYTQRQEPSTEIVDPRYEVAHRIRMERGVVDTWYGLNGTWAMGSLYCEKIMATYQKILAMQVEEPEIEAQQPKETKKAKKSMKARVQEILEKETPSVTLR